MTTRITLQHAQRIKLTRDWRKYGFGRLYWRRAHPNWRDWDSGDVAMAIDSPVRMHFSNLAALRAIIEELKADARGGHRVPEVADATTTPAADATTLPTISEGDAS